MEKRTFAELMFGDMPYWPEWVVLLIMFLIGGFVFQLYKGHKGAKSENGTPSKFKWKYFFTDLQNYFDLLGNILAGYVILRFLIPSIDFEILMLVTIALGGLGQGILDILIEGVRGKTSVVLDLFKKKESN